MGFLRSVFGIQHGSIYDYRFTEIAEDMFSPHIAKSFKESLDSTRSFSWGPKNFYWHEFLDPSGKSSGSKIIWNAKFLKKDEEGNKVYLDSGQSDTGETMYFFFEVNSADDVLNISVYLGNDYKMLSVMVLLQVGESEIKYSP